MREFKIKPDGIIVPGELEIGNQIILKIYYRIYQNCRGDFLPPIIVTQIKDLDKYKNWLEETYRYWENTPDLSSILESGVLYARRLDYKILFDRLKKHPYVLLDGNHRTSVAALTKRKVNCLELETNEDLAELRRKIENGEVFEFNREETDLEQLKKEFIAWCLSLNIVGGERFTFVGGNSCKLRYTKTVGERIEDLIAQNSLPGYMIRDYRQLCGGRE